MILSLLIGFLSVVTTHESRYQKNKFLISRNSELLLTSAGAIDSINHTNVNIESTNLSKSMSQLENNDTLENEIEIIEDEIYIETSTRLNFRVKPNTESQVIEVLPRGAKARIVEKHGEWYKVSRNETLGFVNEKYCIITEDPKEYRTEKIFPNESASAEYQWIMYDLSKKWNIDIELLMALCYRESTYRPHLMSYDGHDYGAFQIRDNNHDRIEKA